MTRLVNVVRSNLDERCLVSGGLNKDGCKVSMRDAPRTRLVIDFDKPGSPLGPDQTRCDYLFVANRDEQTDWVAPLEMKKGHLRANQVVRQLQAGACAAEQFVGANQPVKFRPVVASGSKSRAELRQLKKPDSKVRFHRHAEAVRLISCGEALAVALNT